MLRAVDISSWQAGISPSALDCDIVIVKATGGTGYENPYWRQWADEALAGGKLLGLYHFACEKGSAGTASQEAEHFLAATAPYRGRFVPILDWEADALQMPVSWAREWLEAVSASGCTPIFYGYANNVNSTDYSAITRYPLWMASYLFRYDGAGWVGDPLSTWRTGDWASMAMYQYTSTGRIGGWDGNLDLSIYYGERADWLRLEGVSMGDKEKMVGYAVGIAEDDWHGYSQADRWDRDRDCASLTYDAASVAGFSVGRGPDRVRYTGTMYDDFTRAGFTAYPYGSVGLQRGDILLAHNENRQHTEIYVGDGMTVGAHCSETGGIYGQPGDQTGNEISVAPLWGDWDWVLRPPEDGEIMGKWVKSEKSGKWWYRHEDGSWTSNGWEFIGGKWYYFDKDGWMVTGWVSWEGGWFYCQPKTSKTGNDYGWMVTGSKTIKGKKYYFEPNGAMYKGFRQGKSGTWYCYGPDGAMVTDDSRIKVASTGKIKVA